MFSNFKHTLSRNLVNILGWRTNRKIVVIESDDWGSIRMSSKEAYSALLRNGIRVNECPYCRFDARESTDDLEMLYETLQSVKDKNNNSAKITANFLVANPDFEAIEKSDYQKYSFIRLDQDKMYGANLLQLIKHGNSFGLFHPQSHGREHLNISRWMKYLKAGSGETKIAFKNGVYGISTTITNEKRPTYLAALDFETKEEEEQVKMIAENSLKIFEEIFGYQSKSFIPPNYVWGKSLEKVLFEHGVKFLQGNFLHQYTLLDGIKARKRLRPIGSISKSGLINLSRNVQFEPSANRNIDWLNNALKSIETAFKWKKPAIISSHRLNFMGSLDPENREKNLMLLKQLLKSIQKKWPEVEFMTSDELGELISESKNNG